MKEKRNLLWIFLFLIIFINGFEAGGYQASLYSIGKTYDLSITNMGIFASVELFATMLAPIILGSWADRTDKTKCILILLTIQTVFAATIFISSIEMLFVVGIFFLGMTTSALQFISIAALAEVYSVSSKRKIGFMTSMYAFGALVAPLVVNFYLNRGLSWKTLFLTLSIGSTIAIAGTVFTRNAAWEQEKTAQQDGKSAAGFVIIGALLLCVIMCIYVGFENGFAFFVDTLFTDVLNSSLGKFALSLFWAVMIPSRVLVGLFSKHSKKILIAAIVAIPVFTIAIANVSQEMAVMLLCVPLGFACGAIYPCVLNVLMNYSGNRKATATAMVTVSTGIGGVVFTAFTGVLAESFGIAQAMMILSSCYIVSLAAALTAVFGERLFIKNQK